MNKLIVYLFLIFIFSSSIYAGDYQIVYNHQFDGVDNYTNIEPFLDSNDNLAGYILSNKKEIVCMPLGYTSPIFIDSSDLFYESTKSVYSYNGDTLYVFAAEIGKLLRYTIYNDFSTIHKKSIAIELQRSYFYTIDYLKLIYDEGIPTHIQISNTFSWDYFSGQWDEELHERSKIFIVDFNLNYLLDELSSTYMELGDLNQDGISDTLLLNNVFDYRKYKIYHPDGPDEWISEKSRNAYLELYSSLNDNNISISNENIFYRSIFIDDFFHSSPGNEFVIQYINLEWDLPNHIWDSNHHSICYRYDNDSLEVLWTNDTYDLIYQYYIKSDNILVGTGGRYYHEFPNDSLVIFVNAENGNHLDTVFLERQLETINFFESSGTPPLLNLIGRTHDTVFVFQFQIPTDINDFNDNQMLLRAFTLYQNHPNPFNNTTNIHFDVQTRDLYNLKIYNILGEEVQL